MVEKRQRPPIKFLAPNIFTGVSLLFGMASVLTAADGNYNLAGWFILWCVMLDKLDGTVARLLKATSSFGLEFDSITDFMAFGVAPVVLLYRYLTGAPETATLFGEGPGHVVLVCSLGFFLLAVAVRLARYNVKTMPWGDRFFYGLPTTLVGALLTAMLLTHIKYQIDTSLLMLYPLYLFVGGLLMVSNYRIPKLVRRKNPVINIFQWANILLVLAFSLFQLFPEYLLLAGLLYAVVGLVYCLVTAKQFEQSDPDLTHK